MTLIWWAKIGLIKFLFKSISVNGGQITTFDLKGPLKSQYEGVAVK